LLPSVSPISLNISVPKFSDSNPNETSVWTTNMIIKNGGNVGIGTTSPSEELHIKSATGSNAWIFVDSTDSNDATSDAGIEFREGGNFRQRLYNDGDDAHKLILDGVSSSNIMVWDANTGNVGIGTSSPGYLLHVEGSAATVNIGIKNTLSGSDWRLMSTGTGAGEGSGKFAIRDQTNLVTVLVIENSSGNIGIGTTTPAAQFHIYNQPGTSAIIESENLGTEILRLIGDTDGSNGGPFYTVFEGNGNVGIGKTSPTSLLHLKSDI